MIELHRWPLWACLPILVFVRLMERYQDWKRGEVRVADLPPECW